MKFSHRLSLMSALALAAFAFAGPVYALNYFELEVYPYQTAVKGELELENSTAYTDSGTRQIGVVDNNSGLLRTSVEATYGVTNKIEVSAYADGSHPQGGAWQWDGQRYHARMRFFEKGELPVDLGAYVELELPRHDPDQREAEFRGIVEKDVGRWTYDFNPIFEKVLKGANVHAGWDLQYAAAAVYRMNERYHPRLDFFGDFGPLSHFAAATAQQHLISPALDIRFTPTFHILAGMAFGMTRASEQRLLRLQIEKEFY
ncbi:MAG: hypothetical protein ACYDDO_04140 [Acidiferrobacterales bacterium]